MARPISVPSHVMLPAGRSLRPMEAYRAMGVSRMTVWRKLKEAAV